MEGLERPAKTPGYDMQVAILAGGLATRLEALTRERPKSMVRVWGKPFLSYQLELLRRQGIEDIVLCTGHLGQQIESYFGNGRKHGVSIKYSIEDRLLGTAGALKHAESLLADTFFTLYGDSYLFLDFAAAMHYFQSRNKLALMTVYKNHNRYDRSNTVIRGDLVQKFSKREKTGDMVYIEYGANIFSKKALSMVPGDCFYPLDELFSQLIAMGQLLAFELSARFYEIGSPQGLMEFTEYMRRVE